ncbi:hypothetical protein AB0C44_07985 [Micromonospora taraxaci]|uniref:hypothetical protein n=1 Tax=Micromonospora taraxaci TaxID=1316803 RepID=UPI0033DB4F4B
MKAGLCFTQPPEFWETGDDGNRLALALCRACPLRRGDTCGAGLPDPKPTGVIRAGVAYNERGGVCPICVTCGYPVADLPHRRQPEGEGCRYCRVPTPKAWSRKAYWAARYRAKKTTTSSTTRRTEETAA